MKNITVLFYLFFVTNILFDSNLLYAQEFFGIKEGDIVRITVENPNLPADSISVINRIKYRNTSKYIQLTGFFKYVLNDTIFCHSLEDSSLISTAKNSLIILERGIVVKKSRRLPALIGGIIGTALSTFILGAPVSSNGNTGISDIKDVLPLGIITGGTIGATLGYLLAKDKEIIWSEVFRADY